MKLKTWTAEEDAFVTAQWQAGRTIRQIAAAMAEQFEVGRGYNAINGRIDRLRLKRSDEERNANRPRMEEDRRADIIQRYQAGDTITSIARAYGVSIATMSDRLRVWGIRQQRRPTSRHDDPQFIALWEAGTSTRKIAEIMGVHINTADRWAAIGRRLGTIKPKGAFMPAWTPEEEATLRRLWGEGHGPAEISRRTGWTKNRIGSKARTMGLPVRSYPAQRAKAKGRDYSHLRRAAQAAAAAAAEQREAARRLREERAASLWAYTDTSRPFMERMGRECAWPLGERGSFHACCAETPEGDTYCQEHRLIAGGGRTAAKDRFTSATGAIRKRPASTVFDAGQMAA